MRTALVVPLVYLTGALMLTAQQGPGTENALQQARSALLTAEAEHGADSVIAAKARLVLAKQLFREGQLLAAAAAARACANCFEAHLPAEELVLSETWLVLGAIAGRSQDLLAAESSYRRALALRERLEPAGSPTVQLLRFNLAVTLQQLSDYPGGLQIAEIGLREAEQQRGADSQAAGHFVSIAALCLAGLGRTAEAYERFVRAERILKSTRGDNYPDALRMAGLAGTLACSIGRSAEGLPKIATTLAAMRKVPNLDPEILLELRVADVVLRSLYRRDTQAFDDLRKLLVELTAQPQASGTDVHLLKVMAALGDVDASVIDVAAAKRALAAWELQLGSDHVYLAGALANMARLCFALGKVDEAEPYIRRADAIVEASPWLVSPDRWKIAGGMIRWLWHSGDLDGAVARAQRSLAEAPRLLDAWSSPLDERQRLEFTAAIGATVDVVLSLGDQVALTSAERWRAVLNWKGLVSRGLLQSLEWLQQNHDPEAQQLTAELRTAVARWSALVAKKAPTASIDAARQAREAIERRLTQHLVARPVDLPDPTAVAAGLAADEVLIDFFTYGHVVSATAGSDALEQRLIAFVVKRGEAPLLVELGPLQPVTQAVAAFLQVGSRWTRQVAGAEELVRTAGMQLVALIWQPLCKRIPSGSKVVICPDSVVALVPFAALPGAQAGSFLVEDFEFSYVATAADLRLREPPLAMHGPQRLLAVGDVDYGEQAVAGTRRDGIHAFAPLPGSGVEIDAVVLAMAHDSGASAIVLRGATATAERFAAAVVGANFVHIATHGWFRGSRGLPDPAQRWALFEATGKALPADALSPGADSGLAFAGANLAPVLGHDSMLTADEIALLDLSQCQLAVLSACETALGTISSGDGLLGLRRSLRLAGAKRSLTSVWSVEDAATQHCMQAFYSELKQHQLTPAAALRAAQLLMLAEARKSCGQALVGTWGAFVLESR